MTDELPLLEIQSIEDIQRLVVSGFTDWRRCGDVNVRSLDDLLIFNYSQFAQYAGRWNYFEQVSRGLILHRKTGEIIARAFDKFFNWLEGGRTSTGKIVTVTEKVDGSLGVLYRFPVGDSYEYRIATRGSFDGMQAVWATEFLHTHHDLTGLADELTLLFEIVYPDNRVVVNYGERNELVLLAARNRYTGAYLPFFPDVQTLASQYGFSTPRVYQFSDLQQILVELRRISVAEEGYVVEFSDGQRFKFKGDRYMELQKLIIGLTFKNILAAMMNNSVQQIFETVPDEYLGTVREWIAFIETTIAEIQMRVDEVFEQAPKESRKEFAVWVNTNYPELSGYLFNRFSGYDIVPLIYRRADWSKYMGGEEAEQET